jgi:hypothetical protein
MPTRAKIGTMGATIETLGTDDNVLIAPEPAIDNSLNQPRQHTPV